MRGWRLGKLVKKLGVIGYNPGNGHPFSFSAIVNGYSDEGFERADWPVIHDYLRAKDTSEFGFGDVRVSHAWTQDPAITQKLCAASRIEHAADTPEQMISEVDGVLICRHDSETHVEYAMPFLKAGVPAYVDKPLSLVETELTQFRPYLENGMLMSCSGMRYAREIDDLRASLSEYGEIRLIRGAVVLDWAKYGIHLVDAILTLDIAEPVSVSALSAKHESMVVRFADESIAQIDSLGDATKNFKLEVYASLRDSSHQLFDNFTAFRRAIGNFLRMCDTREPPIAPDTVMTSMKILMAGIRSSAENREVRLDEFSV